MAALRLTASTSSARSTRRPDRRRALDPADAIVGVAEEPRDLLRPHVRADVPDERALERPRSAARGGSRMPRGLRERGRRERRGGRPRLTAWLQGGRRALALARPAWPA